MRSYRQATFDSGLGSGALRPRWPHRTHAPSGHHKRWRAAHHRGRSTRWSRSPCARGGPVSEPSPGAAVEGATNATTGSPTRNVLCSHAIVVGVTEPNSTGMDSNTLPGRVRFVQDSLNGYAVGSENRIPVMAIKECGKFDMSPVRRSNDRLSRG